MAMHPHLIDPVRVEHAQAAQLAARTLLCNTSQVPGRFQLRDALVHWLTVHNALRRATSGQHRANSFPYLLDCVLSGVRGFR